MSKLPLILILSVLIVGQHRAVGERCRIEIHQRSDLVEECDATLVKTEDQNSPAFRIKCSPLINQTSNLKLCKDTLASNPQIKDVCTFTLEFNFLAVHNEFLPPDILTKCVSILVPSLVIKNDQLIETKALDKNFFERANKFVVKHVDISNTRLMENSSTSNLIGFMGEPDEIKFRGIESTQPLQLVSSKTNIFIEKGRFHGIEEKGLQLMGGVQRLELYSVSFGQKRVNGGAINVLLGSATCPKEFNLTIHDTLTSEKMDNDPISLVYNCRDSVIKLNIDLGGNGFWPLIPEQHFKGLLQALLNQRWFDFSFNFGQIDCCNVNNAWIFELAEDKRINILPKNLNIPCEDIGATVYNYTRPGTAKDACDKRNVTPIYIIAVVAVIFITIFLLGFSCLCIMYVLPKKRLDIDAAAGSEADAPGYSSGVIETRSDHSGVKLLGSGGSGGSRTGAKSSIGKSRVGTGTPSQSGASSRISLKAPAKKQKSTSASKRHRAKATKRSAVGSVTTAATEATNGSENSIKTFK